MKILFACFLLSINIICYSQTTPESFWNNRCEYNTDGTGKSLGLKIKISVPCAWKQKDGDRPHIVQNFNYSFSEGSSLTQTLLVRNMPRKLSKAETNEMFSHNGLKEIGESIGTYISSRKLRIDGLDCGEIIYKMERENPIGHLFIYGIQYYIIYKDKMIILSFASGSLNYETSKSIFETHQTLFKGIAGTMVFISKWE
jgi:hypothetical protein